MNKQTMAGGGDKQARRMADATTPLIRNCWYVAGLASEFDEGLSERRILGELIVLYRTDTGRLAALDNRCPHRSFPLSKGCLNGSAITCGYHGLTFDADGRCIAVPSQKSVPASLAIRSYPMAERGPLAWIWMGDPALADEAAIPDHFDIEAQGWSAVTNYTLIEADYVGLHENLQDLTHFTFLHGSSIGIPQFEGTKLDIELDGDRVYTRRESRDLAPPPFWARTLPLRGDRIDRVITTAFKGPALCDGTMVITDLTPGESGENAEYTAQILHFLTPASQLQTHYRWFVVRDFGVDDTATGQAVLDGFTSTFAEDKFALEEITALKQRDHRPDFVEKSVNADKAGMRMRLNLDAMAAQESRQEAGA